MGKNYNLTEAIKISDKMKKSSVGNFGEFSEPETDIADIKNREEQRKAIAKKAIQNARLSGNLAEYGPAKEIIEWMYRVYPGITFISVNDQQKMKSIAQRGNVFSLTDDLEIDIMTNYKFNIKLGVPNDTVPSFVKFNVLYGDLNIENNKYLREFPKFIFKTVVGNISLWNLPNLTSLANCPKIIGEDHILKVYNCINLPYADIKRYMTANGVNAKTDAFDMEESINSKSKFQRIVESRISIGREYMKRNITTINEKFNSEIINNLVKKNRNTDHRNRNNDMLSKIVQKIQFAWSEITDDVITPISNYSAVKNAILSNKNINNTKGSVESDNAEALLLRKLGEEPNDIKAVNPEYGLMLFTDADDRVNAAYIGDSADAPVYVSDKVKDNLKDRIELLKSIKKQFTEFGVDFANFPRGGKDIPGTLRNFIANFAYMYEVNLKNAERKAADKKSALRTSWIYNSPVFESIKDDLSANEFISTDELRDNVAKCLNDFIGSGRMHFSNNADDKLKFINHIEAFDVNISRMFNPEFMRTILRAINIRTKKYSIFNIYSDSEINDMAAEEIYSILNEMALLPVGNTLLFNLQLKTDELNTKNVSTSNELSSFAQLLAVPDMVAKLYYFSSKLPSGTIDSDRIDTATERNAHFTVGGQEKYLQKLRKERIRRVAGQDMSRNTEYLGGFDFNEPHGSEMIRSYNANRENNTIINTHDYMNSVANRNYAVKPIDIKSVLPEKIGKEFDAEKNSANKLIKYATDIIKQHPMDFTEKYVPKLRKVESSPIGASFNISSTSELHGMLKNMSTLLRKTVDKYESEYQDILDIPVKFGRITEPNRRAKGDHLSIKTADGEKELNIRGTKYYTLAVPSEILQDFMKDKTSEYAFTPADIANLHSKSIHKYRDILNNFNENVFSVKDLYISFMDNLKTLIVAVKNENEVAIIEAVASFETLANEMLDMFTKNGELDRDIHSIKRQIYDLSSNLVKIRTSANN